MKSKPNSPIEQFKYFVRNKYAWPGWYPMYAVFRDGDTLCHKCAKEFAKLIIAATRDHDGSSWEVVGVEVNWENAQYCDHCGDLIESAYGEVQQ